MGRNMSRDPHSAVMACIGTLYDAASGSVAWIDVGAELRRLFAADRAGLIVPTAVGRPQELLAPVGDAEAAYAAYFHSVDPIRRQAQRDFAEAPQHHLMRAKLGSEIVPEHELLRSEYYTDFARHHGRRYVVGGILGRKNATPIGLYRAETSCPFTPEDCRLLEMLLPHVQRALDLRERLAAQDSTLRVTVGVLDMLPTSMVIVDAGSRVRFANAAARRALSRPGSGMAMLASGPSIDGGTHLTALHRDDARSLRQLVAATSQGGAGGSLRIRPRDDGGDLLPMQAALISPVPASMLADADPATRGAEGLALVVIEELVRRASPPAAMLCDLFGLSRAEAEVAIRLVGGTSAEDVAQGRAVSLDTVRNQIRAILRKSEAANLRDLERLLARLAAIGPGTTTRSPAD